MLRIQFVCITRFSIYIIYITLTLIIYISLSMIYI